MRDPVCGMILEENDVKATVKFEDCVYRFCSEDCKQKFVERPRYYLSDSALGA